MGSDDYIIPSERWSEEELTNECKKALVVITGLYPHFIRDTGLMFKDCAVMDFVDWVNKIIDYGNKNV